MPDLNDLKGLADKAGDAVKKAGIEDAAEDESDSKKKDKK